MKATSIIGISAVCFVLLALLTVVLAGSWIENDLTKRSLNDLKAAGHDWASVEMDGRDAILTGTPPDAEASKAAAETVSEVWGIRIVTDLTN